MNGDTNCRWVYMTAGSLESARELGRLLVERRLAACVNLLPGMRSLYRWEGKVAEDEEVVMIAKTTAERLPDLKATVAEAHPYDCPCLLALPVTDGLPEFLDWIRSETFPEREA